MFVHIKLHNKKNLGMYMEYMYNVYNFNTATYEPRHEKICLRGFRLRCGHKTGCTDSAAGWRLEFGIKERTYTTLSSHLHNKPIKTPYCIECKVYKRTETLNRLRF